VRGPAQRQDAPGRELFYFVDEVEARVEVERPLAARSERVGIDVAGHRRNVQVVVSFFVRVRLVVLRGLDEHASQLSQESTGAGQNLAVHDERARKASQTRGELNESQTGLDRARVHEGHHQSLFSSHRLVAV